MGQLVEERGYQASLGWTQSCLAELTAKAKRHLKADMPFPCKCREDQVPEKRKTAQEAQLSECPGAAVTNDHNLAAETTRTYSLTLLET